ncbi:MAG: PQQ-binding-like beta-propeller repeat protein [Verrucomicrobiota bacterium]
MLTRKWMLGCLLFAVTTFSGWAADWPQWHGPNRDNVCTETGLLVAWPADGPPLAWKATGLGGGYAGVAVVGDRIFTSGDFTNGAFVLALDVKSGQLLWQSPLGKSGGGAGYPGPRATPTVAGKLVCALGQHGDLVCLQVSDGKEVWRKNLITDFGGKMMSGWGYTESPLVVGDKLLCTPGGAAGSVVALDMKTGVQLWRTVGLTDAAAYSSLIATKIAGVPQVVVLTGAHVAGLVPETGKVLWSAPRAGSTAVVPLPIIKDDFVFVTSGYGIGCNLFKITRTGEVFKADEVYANKEMVNHHGGVVLAGQNVYGYSDGKGWKCMDFQTGASVWESKKLGKGTLLCAEDHLYLRGESGGTLVLIEATPTGWQEAGRFTQPNLSGKSTWAHLTISGRKLFVRDQDVLLCYNIKN